jgi:preprotein translocase subunit YajC
VLAQAGGFGSNPVLFFGYIAAIFGIMYFLMIRPQQRQQREHRTLLAGLKKGDEVVTGGGLIGRIYAVQDLEVTLEVATGVRVKVLKSTIQGKYKSGAAAEVASAVQGEKKEEK